MDTDHPLMVATLQALAHSFGGTPETTLEQIDTLTLDDVRDFLTPKITALLDRNPDLLMHILYRVDVAERDVKRVFAESPPNDIPLHLADLLIERQLLKQKIRRKYREQDRRL